MSPLMLAAWAGYPNTAKILLQHHADVNARNKNGRTALLIVVQNTLPASLDIVNLLMDHGADPNMADEDGYTALHVAQQAHRADLVALLSKVRAKK